jgi:hypothetical protein
LPQLIRTLVLSAALPRGRAGACTRSAVAGLVPAGGGNHPSGRSRWRPRPLGGRRCNFAGLRLTALPGRSG